ncbi:hypothetical protein RHGRI_027895 [Rhododendron griersonianum]|uniref:ABC-type xenobiotic transporter n=1 Tax=Rhododendron griersonianum TaxID=479676 RepID=A0AAV6IYD5_9ERIC|nr:hypothetical protein RHGRI_027895 [Rhododendron griersonianum]
MEGLWDMFCGESDCSAGMERPCSTDFKLVTQPSSCMNHAMIIGFDMLIMVMFLFNIIRKKSSKSGYMRAQFRGHMRLQIISAIFNGVLGVIYLCLAIWVVVEMLRLTNTALPLHWLLLLLVQGLTWLSVGITVSLRGNHFPKASSQLLSIVAFLFAGISCGLSLSSAISIQQASIKVALDLLSFLGASLLLLCTYMGSKYEEIDDILYAPLNGEVNGNSKSESVVTVTPFSKANFFSKMSFWWLNPLMTRGKEKTLEDEDIPKLREEDRAEACYLLFTEQFNKQKQLNPSSQPSVLKTLILCHWNEILVSGFFALLTIVTVSAGPLLLNAFIEVAEGKESFKYEGYALAISLFFSKSLESLAQRQWYFRSRLVGLKVRSLLTAAIYKKQLKLSNAAKMVHSVGEITNYVTVDAYRIGEFPFWFHQTWTTSLQLCFALIILYRAVGLATVASMVVIILTVLCNAPLAKLQHKFQSKLMVAQDERLKASQEALVNMKVLKLYAWENHFKNVIKNLRNVEYKWLLAVQLLKSYNSFFFWTSPVLVSTATFAACYFLGVPLYASNVFTFVATLRLVQDPVRSIPDVIGVTIQAKVAFSRIVKFLEAPEQENANVRQKSNRETKSHAISIQSADFSWEVNPAKPTLRNINLDVRPGEKLAICGEVGSGKSTLLAAILGEVPNTQGTIRVYGTIAYVSQSAWIQTGSIRDNILFGSALDSERYQETLEKCSLVKDLELLPHGDLTEIGERGVNLSGGQKQRIQLARALYQDADIYLLDDPFSAVDAHTATSLFNEYVMGVLSMKTVLLVTHQVDFLPAFHSVLLLLDGEILHAVSYHQLLASSQEFQDLVNAHKETAGAEKLAEVAPSQKRETPVKEIRKTLIEKNPKASGGDQLIKLEEREVGDTGIKPYIQYLNQNKGYVYFSVAWLCHLTFVIGQILQNSWMAANVDNPHVSTLRLITVYLVIGFSSTIFLLGRSLSTVSLGMQSSKSLFSQLLNSLFRAPMSFYDSTPLGRILSRVSADLSIVDIDIPFSFIFCVGATTNSYANLTVLAVVTWQVLFVSIPMLFLAIRLQRYYFASAKELMRINGTTKSFVANHLAESIAGCMTIRAFEEEGRFFAKNLDLIDINASPFFHTFAANEWLIQRLGILSASVLSSSALCMVLLPPGTFSSGFIGMALSYGLSLNGSLVVSIQCQCTLANQIISVERLNQYMHIPSEAPEVIEENRPPVNWPSEGKVEIQDLQIRYRPDAPLVLRGISCTFGGGHKIGIVGRTGSGKTTLIGALFRLVEPSVMEDGSNWSMGQRQLFCLGRALLRRSKILVLDEATASIDNATDLILQRTIRTEFADCTVITVAHRIPTVMDCTMVLAISDGYDDKMLIETRLCWVSGLRKEMEGLWAMFCGESDCSAGMESRCSSDFKLVTQPSSCMNHAMIIGFDILIMVMFLFNVIHKKSSKSGYIRAHFRGSTRLQIISAIFNGVLGVIYLSFGIWMLVEMLWLTNTVLPLHWLLLVLVQGLTWLLVGLTVSLRGKHFSKASLQLLSILAFLFAGIACGLSLLSAVSIHQVSFKVALDALSFLGASLLLLCTYKGYTYEQIDDILYVPLNGEVNGSSKTESIVTVTPFSKANFFSKISFWWLNPLMTKGKEKTLEDEDIPKLRKEDRAKACYLQFTEQFNKQKRLNPSSQPSVLKTLILCHWKEILVSGFFALLTIVTVSAGPLLLNAFVKVAEGKENFKYEGYVLAISLFFSKSIESSAQRQWYFRSRLVGLKVRSLLTAVIYKKQLKLSNTAKMMRSAGEITNYVTVDAYRVGEFPFWFHQTWTTSLQLCFSLIILYRAVGLATIASMVVIILTVLCNTPLAKLQRKFQSKLMAAQDERLKASQEALVNMKVLKLYGWQSHFKNVIENLRSIEYKYLSAALLCKSYNNFLFWSSPILVSTATFAACYFLGVPLYASNVFTFVATLRLVREPVRSLPDVIAATIQAKVAFSRIVKFLEAPELEKANIRQNSNTETKSYAISIKSANFSWEVNPSKPPLGNTTLEVRPGEKLAICGEVGSGKSTLLAAILGEVPNTQGTIQVRGTMAYVSQSAWIQRGSIRDNILFGSALDGERYQEALEKCSLVKDLELLPYGDLTEIGERGVNLSGGQKQRVQLARALYQDADIYLLDDPFSAVDAHTASSLFNEYVMGALSTKTVLLVTHQVDFLPAFHSILLMSDGEILHAASYHQLLASSQEFQDLVNAHKETAGAERLADVAPSRKCETPVKEIRKAHIEKNSKTSAGHQLIKLEEREVGDTGIKPYRQYLNQNKGYLYFSMASLCHLAFAVGQILQNSWMAANVDNPHLLNSLFLAPMSFYDSTPLGRILSRVSVDMSIVDIDIAFSFISSVGATTNAFANLTVLATVTWQVLFVSIAMMFLAICLQRYYFASAKELMRINGTTKSFVANHLAESIAGSVTIRAFEEEDRFFVKNLDLIDINASPFFHSFAANEWLIQRLGVLSAVVLSSSALCMVLLPPGTFSSGFIGMALSYGLSLNVSLVNSIRNQCTIANQIISVERLNQYMHIPSEAPEVIEENRPPFNWPTEGKVEIQDLQIRYRADAPLVLRGISCTFEGGNKIGIVGRTGSGKTTLISALFRLVEPSGGNIVVDGIDISRLGLHDLRSRFGIIPQDPTLFNGTVRYNLDPLSQHTDQEIWEVIFVEDGSNWSMGQRQLFCLGRALLRRSKILVLDEATASIDNATDLILQRTIRTEFADCTVITVAHRIPTVMDCTMVLAISDGKLVEYDEPMNLMKREGSLFGQLVKEYWSHYDQSAEESH